MLNKVAQAEGKWYHVDIWMDTKDEECSIKSPQIINMMGSSLQSSIHTKRLKSFVFLTMTESGDRGCGWLMEIEGWPLGVVIPVYNSSTERRKWRGQVKVIFSYIESLRPAGATGDPVSQKQTAKRVVQWLSWARGWGKKSVAKGTWWNLWNWKR